MVVEREDTEKLIDELMKMDIPTYKPSANHVQLTDAGILSTLQHTALVTILTLKFDVLCISSPTLANGRVLCHV